MAVTGEYRAAVKLLRDLGVDLGENPPRMKAVCRAIEAYKMHITFPNGLRFDIMDEQGCEALARAGTGACVAIESIMPRLLFTEKRAIRRFEPASWSAHTGCSLPGIRERGRDSNSGRQNWTRCMAALRRSTAALRIPRRGRAG